MIYGYERVSTATQEKDGNSLEDQTKLILERYPSAEIVAEAYSGAKERAIFNALIEKMESGDTLVVTKLDRFCRATKEGLQYIDILMAKGVNIHILNMGLIEDTPMGRMIVTQLLAFAEFERAMIKERTMAGKKIARNKEGYKEGRKPVDMIKVDLVKTMIDNGINITTACKEVGIGRTTYYKYAS